jgi:AcrR family transcriptional regulator
MPRSSASLTRDRILDVTADLMRSSGLAAVTTREIARAAGLTEAALYRHFKSKEDLLTNALAERLPLFIGMIKDLPQKVGQGTVRDNLQGVAVAAVPFYRQAMPMLAAIFGDPNLLARHRVSAEQTGMGPQRANAMLSEYLRAEAALGRVPGGLDADTVAALLLGAALQRAFFDEFLGKELDAASIAEYSAKLIDTLLPSAEPPTPAV